jgi:hypothetical protein
MTDLKAELEALRAELAELKEKMKPKAPFVSDYVPPSPNRFLDRASMSPEATRIMVEAVGDGMVRDIVNGNRAPTQLAPLASPPVGPRVADEDRSGWREPAPLSNPPGVAIADRLMDAQDARDRAELIAQEARRRLVEKRE